VAIIRVRVEFPHRQIYNEIWADLPDWRAQYSARDDIESWPLPEVLTMDMFEKEVVTINGMDALAFVQAEADRKGMGAQLRLHLLALSVSQQYQQSDNSRLSNVAFVCAAGYCLLVTMA
jgi:hypothetical protein